MSPVGLCQAIVHLRREVLQASNNQLQFRLQSDFLGELLSLLLRLDDTAPQAEDARLKLLLVNEAVRIAVNEPRQPLA